MDFDDYCKRYNKIDASVLGLSESGYQSIVCSMEGRGLIRKIGEPDGVTTTGLQMTPKGEEFSNRKNGELLKTIRQLMQAAASGVTEGTQNHFDKS